MSKLVKKLKTKVENNKIEKKAKLLNSAYKLYSEKGINNTSIQDIAEDAGVAKGTFYLYFKDKYDLQEKLVIQKSNELFNNALNKLNISVINKFDDQLVFIIDNVIDELNSNPDLIKIIYKDLSLAFYNDGINYLLDDEENQIYKTFMRGIEENNIKLDNPNITFYMIIELVSSTVFNSIIKNIPAPIDEYKPYLYQIIRTILNEKN